MVKPLKSKNPPLPVTLENVRQEMHDKIKKQKEMVEKKTSNQTKVRKPKLK